MSPIDVPLEQLVDVVRGVSFPTEAKSKEPGPSRIACLRTTNVQEVVEWDDLLFVDERYLKSEDQCVRLGDILISMSNSLDLVGKCALVTHVPRRATFGTFIAVVRAKPGVNARFVFRAMRSPAFRAHIRDVASTTTNISNINASKLVAATVPLFGSRYCDEVSSRIEELFSEIDEGERALERVGRLVERYRQSFLKAAVTGELTREWRLSNPPAKPTEVSSRIATDTLGDLPAGWDKLRIDEVGEVQLGRQRSPEHHEGEHMRPYLRVANVFEERIDTSDLMAMNFTPEEFERFRLRHGDILLNEGQSKELVGRPAMYRDELPDGCFTNSLVRFRSRDQVLPAFALIVFLHFMKSGDFQRIARITTNIAHLGAGRFAEMAFPLPPIPEQQLIVDAVARQDSVWRTVKAELGLRSRQSSALRQSILKAAFSGQLVPQDPRDEPASALLARLAAQPADAPPSPRRRGRPAGRRSSQPNPEVAE